MESFWEHFRVILMLAGYLLVGAVVAEFVFQLWRFDVHVPLPYLPSIVAKILYYCGATS